VTAPGVSFMAWLRHRPEYVDLHDDAGGHVRSLRGLVRDMVRSGACVEACDMLVLAVRHYADEYPDDVSWPVGAWWEDLAEWAG